jgi:hypothetical protein
MQTCGRVQHEFWIQKEFINRDNHIFFSIIIMIINFFFTRFQN